jgi:hypothetical protein
MVESYHEIGVAAVNFCGEGHAIIGSGCGETIACPRLDLKLVRPITQSEDNV